MTSTFLNNSDDALMKIEKYGLSYIIPVICLIGALLHMFSFIIILKVKLENHLFKWMLIKSLSLSLYFFICTLIYVLKCYCSEFINYMIGYIDYFLYSYLAPAIIMFSLLIECSISMHHTAELSENVKTFNQPTLILLFYLLFSLFLFTFTVD